MTKEQIVSDFQKFCIDNSNEELVKKYSGYFKEGYDAYGLSSDLLRQKVSDTYSKIKDSFTVNDYMDLGDLLFESGKYEEGSFAVLLAQKIIKTYTPKTIDRIGCWLDMGVTNWAHTDVISGDLISPCLENSIIAYKDLALWRTAQSRWKRRSVPVSLIIMAKRKPETIIPLLDFIDVMMPDGERVVHQGLGWFLREAWKKQPEPVESFLIRWKNDAARLIFQYATEKMTKEAKTKFKREKK
jgi:3-methyladenine DNA glycosylase AlkD